jgi:hypothetical protein
MLPNKLTIAFHVLPVEYEFIPQVSVIQWKNNWTPQLDNYGFRESL